MLGPKGIITVWGSLEMAKRNAKMYLYETTMDVYNVMRGHTPTDIRKIETMSNPQILDHSGGLSPM
jgi:hypothetical protein